MTKEWQEYRDAQNKKHAEERARTVRDDPSRYVSKDKIVDSYVQADGTTRNITWQDRHEAKQRIKKAIDAPVTGVSYGGAQSQAYSDGENRNVVLRDQASVDKWKREEISRKYSNPDGAGAQGQANSAGENQAVVSSYKQADGTWRNITVAERDAARQRVKESMNAPITGVSYGGAQSQSYSDGKNHNVVLRDQASIDKWKREEYNRKYGNVPYMSGNQWGAGQGTRNTSRISADAPVELQQFQNILGVGLTNNGLSFGELEKYFGRMNYSLDANGNIVGDYRNMVEKRINLLYGNLSKKEKNDLMEGTLLLIRAEHDKNERINEIKARGGKVLDVSNQFNTMVKGTINNNFWYGDFLGFAKISGKFYFKNSPETIIAMAGSRIPVRIQNEALRRGGQEGVGYLMEQGYGYFKVGDKVFNPEELGNYALGVVTAGKGIDAGISYGVGDIDRHWNNLGKPFKGEETVGRGSEVYDLYYLGMGREDADKFGKTGNGKW